MFRDDTSQSFDGQLSTATDRYRFCYRSMSVFSVAIFVAGGHFVRLVEIKSRPRHPRSPPPRARWANPSGAAPSTLYRAYYDGALRGSKVGPRSLIFTRADILVCSGSGGRL